MMRLVMPAAVIAALVAGWRNLEPMPTGSSQAAGVFLGAVCFLCWYAGKTLTRDKAMAVAMAHAEAHAAASAIAGAQATAGVHITLDPSLGARAVGARSAWSSLDDVEWRGQISHDGGDALAEDVVTSMVEDIGEHAP